MTCSKTEKLSDISSGQTAVIKGFTCKDRQFFRLAPMGLLRGKTVLVVRNNRRNPLLIEVQQTTIAISREVAGTILTGRPDAATN